MISPRRQIVDPSAPDLYHCVSRCVRRAFLCGEDSYTGKSFEHRKAWVEERLLELARHFAVGVYAYAVMSNHLHVVLHIDPGTAAAWSPEEVARRWVGVFPVCVDGVVDELACAERARTIAADPERSTCRERLASLSWFVRSLCGLIARRSNREDGCTRRFWEGSCKCQALLDGTCHPLRPDQRGRMAGPPPPAVARFAGGDPARWVQAVGGIERDDWRAVGAVDALLDKAQAMGQFWLKGLGVAKRVAQGAGGAAIADFDSLSPP